MAEYTTTIDIEAAPAVVFDYLVTEQGMTAWMGQSASLDARPGGEFSVGIAGHAIRGKFLEVDRPNRVVVSWGVTGSADLPPGASTVAFTLTAISGGTRVGLLHSNLPDPLLPGHDDGWTHFLARLRTAATGGVFEPDDWVPIEDRHAPKTAHRQGDSL